jgi:hypothetical protein
MTQPLPAKGGADQFIMKFAEKNTALLKYVLFLVKFL